MTAFAYGPGVLGIAGISLGSMWFVDRLVSTPYSTAGVGALLLVFLVVLAASLASLLIGSVLIGGSQA